MASKRLLKRDVNYVMGDIIEAAYVHQLANPKQDPKKLKKSLMRRSRVLMS
jgi:hypothetical protein